MDSLNADCWHMIFDLLEPEARTLYSCLFVSKEFFTFSTRVLYRRPLHVFEGECELSPFSRNQLENLLEICTGFATLTTTTDVVKGKQIQMSSSSSTSLPTTATTITTTSPVTTINYYELVRDFKGDSYQNLPQKYKSRWQDYLSCFAETLTYLQLIPQDFDVFLKLVPRFRALKRLDVNSSSLTKPSPPSPLSLRSFSPLTTRPSPTTSVAVNDFLDKVFQFVRLHRQAFPGQLTHLKSHYLKNWNDSAKVQEAIGGKIEHWMSLGPNDQLDWDSIVVSRLKTMSLCCSGYSERNEHKIIELLKRCRVLDELHVDWKERIPFDWSSLVMENDEKFWFDQKGKHAHVGSVEKLQQGQRQQQQQQNYQVPFRLKHLTVQGNATWSVQGMEVFKETLESVVIRSGLGALPKDSCLDWQSSFVMPNLRSITLHSDVRLENLACCPRLETLVLESYRNDTTWSTVTTIPPLLLPTSSSPFSLTTTITTTSVLPITLRRLHLAKSSTAGFDFLWLKPLVNLQDLYLEPPRKNGYESMTMINLSKEIGWWFPRLRWVTLFGRFAVQVQGQILWIAPELKSLNLYFDLSYEAGPLETDSFLFPPSTLDFEKKLLVQIPDQMIDDYIDEPKMTEGKINISRESASSLSPSSTTTTTTTIAAAAMTSSKASFPALTNLTLRKFQFSNTAMTGTTFGDAFFGARPNRPYKTSNDVSIGIDHDDKVLLFPNLEQLEICWGKPQHYLQPCILQAMINMPKLELIRYSEWSARSCLDDTMAEWLQEVPASHPNDPKFRDRPPPATATTTRTKSGEMQNDMCVVRYDQPLEKRYHLRPPHLRGTKVQKNVETFDLDSYELYCDWRDDAPFRP